MKRFIPLLIISLYPFPYFVGESRGNDDESVNSELQRPDRFRVLIDHSQSFLWNCYEMFSSNPFNHPIRKGSDGINIPQKYYVIYRIF